MWLNVLGGVTHSIKWIPVDRRVQDRSLWMEREKRRDDDEGWWRLADGVQRGWSSLLMKSHLRPPFTLNMGRCSCPDLGFDPQRCLTPTISPELPPPSGQHACICAHTHRCICIHTYVAPYMHAHMFTQVWVAGFWLHTCADSLLASYKFRSSSPVMTEKQRAARGQDEKGAFLKCVKCWS